ncbi:MAG TPA: hypothetical protein VFG55_07250 [Rhodanobacteraceae bacterium]|nr:hypothetical protein [Rhodanobacteraceae bacterium]
MARGRPLCAPIRNAYIRAREIAAGKIIQLLGSCACFTPGGWTTIRGATGESVGHRHFAGEHCAFDNQGFMSGGCDTGEWPARAVLAHDGVIGASSRTAARA